MNDITLFDLLIILLKKKVQIILNFILISVVALIFAYNMTLWYQSTVTFIPKSGGGGSGLFAMIGEQMSADIVGNLPFSKRQYLTILNSIELKNKLIDEFNLIEYYDLQESSAPHHLTLKRLNESLTFSVEEEGGLGITDVLSISIHVVDTNKVTAADMANFYYSELEKKVIRLYKDEYTKLGDYLSVQLANCEDSLKYAELQLQKFMNKNKIYSIDDQVKKSLDLYAKQKAELFSITSKIELLKNQVHNQSRVMQQAQHEKVIIEKRLNELELTEKPNVLLGLSNSLDLSAEFSELFARKQVFLQLRQILVQQLKQSQIKRDRDFGGIYLLDNAHPAYYKYKPKRVVYVLMIIAIYMFCYLSFLIFVGLFKKFREGEPGSKWNQKVDELVSAAKGKK